MAHSDKPSSREARHPTGAASSRLSVPSKRFFFSSFFLIFSSILYGYIYFSSCFYGFLFSFFFALKTDWIAIVFSFANLFEAVNFFGDNFFLAAGDLTGCCLF